MVPSQQCLEPNDLFGGCLDDRLVIQLELAGRYRLSQIALKLPALLRVAVQIRCVKVMASLARVFRRIKREIGIADDRIGGDPVG